MGTIDTAGTKRMKRFFVLRDDVARSKDAGFFENILKKIYTYDWSYRKDFKVKKRRFGRKTYVVKGQQLLSPDEWHFNKLEFTDAEKRLFHAEYHYDRWKKKFVFRFVFNEPWRFVLRVRPNMITKKRKIDAEKEARLDEIRNYLVRNDLRKRTRRILDGHYKYVYNKWKQEEKAKEKYRFKNKSFSAVLDFIKEEQG